MTPVVRTLHRADETVGPSCCLVAVRLANVAMAAETWVGAKSYSAQPGCPGPSRWRRARAVTISTHLAHRISSGMFFEQHSGSSGELGELLTSGSGTFVALSEVNHAGGDFIPTDGMAGELNWW